MPGQASRARIDLLITPGGTFLVSPAAPDLRMEVLADPKEAGEKPWGRAFIEFRRLLAERRPDA